MAAAPTRFFCLETVMSNIENVLAAIKRRPGISRAEISRQTGLSIGRVAEIVRHLQEDGQIVHLADKEAQTDDGNSP